jgi:hypothetical protein
VFVAIAAVAVSLLGAGQWLRARRLRRVVSTVHWERRPFTYGVVARGSAAQTSAVLLAATESAPEEMMIVTTDRFRVPGWPARGELCVARWGPAAVALVPGTHDIFVLRHPRVGLSKWLASRAVAGRGGNAP